MSEERKLKEGAATVYIYDKNLHHKDDDPFVMWLKSEGFKWENFGHGNVFEVFFCLFYFLWQGNLCYKIIFISKIIHLGVN